MRNSIAVLSVVLFLFVSTITFSQDVKWLNWEEGYAKAEKENKIILLDAYTEWCGWCKVMDRETYTEKGVQKKIEDKYIPIKLNPELAGTYVFNNVSLSGKQLIEKLSDNKFRGFPSTFFVYPKTSKSYMEVGYIKSKRFNDILDKYVNIN